MFPKHRCATSPAAGLILSLLSLAGTTQAEVIGFKFGVFGSNQNMVLQNTSDLVSITQLQLTLPVGGFFDTAATAPGTAFFGWTASANNQGNVLPSFPDNATTDGQQSASLGFASFDPGDWISWFVGLDVLAAPDIGGHLTLGTLATVTFSDGTQLFATVADDPQLVGGIFYQQTASASADQRLPLVSSLLLLGLGAAVGPVTRRRRVQPGQ